MKRKPKPAPAPPPRRDWSNHEEEPEQPPAEFDSSDEYPAFVVDAPVPPNPSPELIAELTAESYNGKKWGIPAVPEVDWSKIAPRHLPMKRD